MERRDLAPVEPGTRMTAIVGPTAVGKTQIAIEVCRRIGGEIVSVDAMQVYRGMDIGTAKPTPAERKIVPFHMLDIADVTQPFSVARFKELADEAVFNIVSRGRLPVLSGGSGLYYRALVDDLDFANTGGTDRYRVEVAEELEDMDDLELHDLLEGLDPDSAATIPHANRKRVLRAIEVARRGDRLISERQSAWRDYESPYDLVAVGLEMTRHALYRLIDDRVDSMVSRGLVEEVELLRSRGLKRGSTAGEALAYRQLLEYLDGEKSLEDAIIEVKRRTRNLAKRQMTWFKSDPRVRWFEIAVEQDDPRKGLQSAYEATALSILEYFQDNLEN